MDKTSSVLAALDAGKLPSTQQLNQFIDWLSHVGITQLEPSAQGELSSQGRVLADGVRQVLDAYKKFSNNKNADNIVQKAVWHLTEGDVTMTAQAEADKEEAIKELEDLRKALRTLISIVWSSATSEGSSIFQDLLSIIRISLADAAEVVEDQASRAKDSLRNIEKEVQEGERDSLGRSKQRLEEEKDTKVAWQHGMDTVKDAGTSVIGATQSATATAQEKADKTSSRLTDAYYKMCDRAQSDPEYRDALDSLFSIVQKRFNQTIDAASDPNTTLSNFFADPTPEQHIPKAVDLLRTFVERLSGTSLDPLVARTRTCFNSILKDEELKQWFNEFFDVTRKNLSESGYARSDQAQQERKDLRIKWRTILEKDDKWKQNVEDLKVELKKFEDGLRNDKDLAEIQEAHARLGGDIEQGLIEAGSEAQTGLQAAMEQATWFWQDLFKVYVPRVLSMLRDVPIPRTEYKDDEIEFVLENLDVSSFNLLPSHVYIRNITDVDITTSDSPSTPSRTSLGALTHIRIQALQMKLEDVSFWYKDKTASLGPSEFTGLLALNLPEKGVDVDLKIRLIPGTVKGDHSRESMKHFNVIEKVDVGISDDVGLEVRESNHTVLLTVFRPIMISRLKEALERTLAGQLRAFVEWADGVVFDISKRKEVFEDTGLGGGGSLVAAIWSEIGRLQRESRGTGGDIGWRATGTGLVVEQSSTGDGPKGKSQFAIGAEPQILSGEKRGPLGTGSEPLKDRVSQLGEEVGVDVSNAMDVDTDAAKRTAQDVMSNMQNRAKGIVKEGRKQVVSFKHSVEEKSKLEKDRRGWESAAFDFV